MAEKQYTAHFSDPLPEVEYKESNDTESGQLATHEDTNERLEKTVAAFDALGDILKQTASPVRRVASVNSINTTSPLDTFLSAVDDLRSLLDTEADV